METPKKVIQTWKTYTPPLHLRELMEEWKKYCEEYGYEHVLLNDSDLRDKVKRYVPQHLSSYDAFSNHIERVDFARYAILFGEGGVYTDLDTAPLKDITVWVNMNTPVLGTEPKEHAREIYNRKIVVCNAFMISPRGEKLWKDLMEFIISNYQSNRDPVYNTGPMAMTLLLETSPTSYDNVIITKSCNFFPLTDDHYSSISQTYLNKSFPHVSEECDMKDAYVYHVWAHEWCKGFDSRLLNPDVWILILFSIFVLVLIFPPYFLCSKQK